MVINDKPLKKKKNTKNKQERLRARTIKAD